jgi:hypothetical protein
MDASSSGSPYPALAIQDPALTEIQVDNRRLFLVITGVRAKGRPWTLVLERQNDYWISRRELNDRFEPSAAVAGYLFDRGSALDPLDMLRRMNEVVRAEYYRVLQDKIAGERIRSELTEEVARLKGEGEALKAQLRRKLGRGETVGRRSPSVSRKRPPSSRPRRRQS